MKATKFFAAALAVLCLVGFASCNKNDKEEDSVTYKIVPANPTVQVGATLQLSLEPAATAAWASLTPTIATVNPVSGVVTGVAAGPAVITALIDGQTYSTTVTVTAKGGGDSEKPETPSEEINIDPSWPASLKGSNYVILQLDETTAAKLKGRVLADLSIDDNEVNLWVWENTYNAGEGSGKNFYGEAEGWPAFQVSNVGWSGLGQNVAGSRLSELNKLNAIMQEPDKYYFHIAMRSTDEASHCIELDGTTGKGQVTIGATPYDDQGKLISIAGNFTRNGEWGEIEIPMTTFIQQGLQYGSNNTVGINALVFLSGGVEGSMLQYDACFIYKHAE